MRRFRLLLLVLWACTERALPELPAHVTQPLLGSEAPLDPQTRFVLSTGGQVGGSLAASSGQLLYAWIDGREGANEIYASRVAFDGGALDVTGLDLSPGQTFAQVGTLASDGTDFLVPWTADQGLFVRRVSASGTLPDPAPVFVSSDTFLSYQPQSAFGAGEYLVTWVNGPGTSVVSAERVSQAGVPLDAPPLTLITGVDAAGGASVAWGGSNFLVAFQKTSGTADIYATRVSTAGAALDAPGGFVVRASVSSETVPRVASNGANLFLVAWNDARNGNTDVYVARVSSSGVVQDANGIAVSSTHTSKHVDSVTWDGSNFWVVWQDGAQFWPLRHRVGRRFGRPGRERNRSRHELVQRAPRAGGQPGPAHRVVGRPAGRAEVRAYDHRRHAARRCHGDAGGDERQ